MIRIDEMVRVWKQSVLPHHSLVRWMLKPEENRMYEGFCRLEASPHGKLDNLFLFFYTTFESPETYSLDLIKNWLQEYDDPKQREQMAKAGIGSEWNLSQIRQAAGASDYSSSDDLLLRMMESYRNWTGLKNTNLVLSLLPRQMSSPRGFLQWIEQFMAQSRPSGIQLLVYDHPQGNYWGKVFERYREESISLHHDLRMQDAIRQIATAGHNYDPYAYFRLCMFEMGAAAGKKDKVLLNSWGEKAIAGARKSGDKTLVTTAYITFAGMLFSFRDHSKINELLDTGLRLCKHSIDAGDESMKSILLQYYTYKGADCQIQKNRKQALLWFMKAGDEAAQFGFISQAVTAYYKAYVFAAYKDMQDAKIQAGFAALKLTDQLSTEDVQASEYPFMAYDLIQDTKTDEFLKEKVEKKMVEAYDQDWRQTVQELRENHTKKKILESMKELKETM